MAFKTFFKKFMKTSVQATGVIAANKAVNSNNDLKAPAWLRISHGVPTITQIRSNVVARGDIVVPHTASEIPHPNQKVKLTFPWFKREHKGQVSASDILRKIAESNKISGSTVLNQTHAHVNDVDETISESSTTVTDNVPDQQSVPCSTRLLTLSTGLSANGGLDPVALCPNPIISNMVEDVVNPCKSMVLARNTPSHLAQADLPPTQLMDNILTFNPAVAGLINNAAPYLFQPGVFHDQYTQETGLQSLASLVPQDSHGQITPAPVDQGIDFAVYVSQARHEETQHDVPEDFESAWAMVMYRPRQPEEVVEVNIPVLGFMESGEADENNAASLLAQCGRGTKPPRLPSTSTVANSSQNPSDSTVATSVDLITPAVTQEELKTSLIHVHAELEPVEQEAHDPDEQEESEKLRQELERQQLLNQGLRSQVVDREDEVDKLKEELTTTQNERDRYEAEQDNADAQIRRLKQDLASNDKQLAAEKNRSASATQQVQAFRNNHGVSNQQLISQRDEAHQVAQKYFAEVQRLQQSLLATSGARATLEQQVRDWELQNAQTQQQIVDFSEEVSVRLEQANDTISGLEQQNVHLLQQKERAEGQVKALNKKITLEYLEDPSPPFNPRTTKPDEVRDLTQALEMTQKHCADLTEQSTDLHRDVVKKDEENSQLRTDLDLQKTRAARLVAGFEILRNKLANWTETLPLYAQMKDGMDIDSVPGLKEALDQSALHEEIVTKEVRDHAEEVSNLEIKLAKVERRHSRALEEAHKRVADLQERNIRLDGENFNLNTRVEEVEILRGQVKEMTSRAEEWRMQAMHQKYGDTAKIIHNEHKEEVEDLRNQVNALNKRIWEWSSAYDNVALDLNMIQWRTAKSMGDVRELEAERDWYQAWVNALKARFEVDLLANPINIPWRSDFSLLNTKNHIELVAREDMIIDALTGCNMGRSEELVDAAAKDARKAGEEKGPRGKSATDIWSNLVQEYVESQKTNAGQ